jgi:hypothetical protein
VDAYLRAPADPDTVAGVFGEVLAVQGAQQIAEAREADDELVPKIRLAEFAGEHDRRADPGVRLSPVLHHFRSVVVESLSRGLLAGFVDGPLIRAWYAGMAQGDARNSALLPGHFPPVHEMHKTGDLYIVVVIVEELFEDIQRAVQAQARCTVRMLCSNCCVNALDLRPIEIHSKFAAG